MNKLTQADIINLKVGCTVQQFHGEHPIAAPREVIHVGKITQIKLPRYALFTEERIRLTRLVTWKTNGGREVTINLQEGHFGFVIAHPTREIQPGQPADSPRDRESVFGDLLPPNASGSVFAGDCNGADTGAPTTV